MKIKLDENLPARLATVMVDLGYDVDSVIEEGLSGQNDDRVWEAAQDAGRFLITQDLDFSDIRKFAPGSHYGILLIRLREPGRVALYQRILSLFQTEDVATWEHCYVVATERKIRIQRPQRQ